MVLPLERTHPLLQRHSGARGPGQRGRTGSADPPDVREGQGAGSVAPRDHERVPLHLAQARMHHAEIRLDVGIRERPVQEQIPVRDASRGIGRFGRADRLTQVDILQDGVRAGPVRLEIQASRQIHASGPHGEHEALDREPIPLERGLDRLDVSPRPVPHGEPDGIEHRHRGLAPEPHLAVQGERRVPERLAVAIDDDLVVEGQGGDHVTQRPVSRAKTGHRHVRDRGRRRAELPMRGDPERIEGHVIRERSRRQDSL